MEPGFPDDRGDILNFYSAVCQSQPLLISVLTFRYLFKAQLNLARLDLQENRIERPEFLKRVRNATVLVQEAVRCKSCVRIDRSLQIPLDHLMDEMSTDSEASCDLTFDM